MRKEEEEEEEQQQQDEQEQGEAGCNALCEAAAQRFNRSVRRAAGAKGANLLELREVWRQVRCDAHDLDFQLREVEHLKKHLQWPVCACVCVCVCVCV